MALIKCYECNRQISDQATTCPHCGAPQDTQTSPEESGNQSTNVSSPTAASDQEKLDKKSLSAKEEIILFLFVAGLGLFVYAKYNGPQEPSQNEEILARASSIDVGAQKGQGYSKGDTKLGCRYSQIMRENNYFMKVGNSNTSTMEFDSFVCLKATRDNKLLINNLIFRQYVQPWVEFDYSQFERSDHAVLQGKGFCISSTNTKVPIVVMIDYGIRDGYFTYVEHAAGIPPCGK